MGGISFVYVVHILVYWSESSAIPRMRNVICIDSTLGEYRSALINIESIKLSS
jgi:hypothetical protein